MPILIHPRLETFSFAPSGFAAFVSRYTGRHSIAPHFHPRLELVVFSGVELAVDRQKDLADTIRLLVEMKSTQGKTKAAVGCAVSKYHLCRIFKETTGYTIGSYLTKVRIDRACTLLAGGSSVAEACDESGFGNLSHFIKTFRTHTGSSPGAWARSMMEGTSHLTNG